MTHTVAPAHIPSRPNRSSTLKEQPDEQPDEANHTSNLREQADETSIGDTYRTGNLIERPYEHPERQPPYGEPEQ